MRSAQIPTIKYFPLAVFMTVVAIGAAVTAMTYRASQETFLARFEVEATNAVGRVVRRIEEHLSLLHAAHAFFSAHDGLVDRAMFRVFIDGLDIANRYNGIQGIGFAILLDAGREAAAEDLIEENYGFVRDVWPETAETTRTPIVLLEPNDSRNLTAIGFDMYSEAHRREAMDDALHSNSMRASAPVELVQELTGERQAGFLVYFPFHPAGTTQIPDEKPAGAAGFVYAPFRAGDLHRAALSRTIPGYLAVRTFDVTDGSRDLLYQSDRYDELISPAGIISEIPAKIAGREWLFEVSMVESGTPEADIFPSIVMGVLSLILALALAGAAYWQGNALGTAHALADAQKRNLQEKDMILQEMKHRIKNSIARVSAIARQTAAHSDSTEEFNKSFAMRMNAMAAAQDMLTRSHWGRADMGKLLRQELEQVFGEGPFDQLTRGPQIDMNGKATQALGLVFHELATNALKYGQVTKEKNVLDVEWRREESAKDGTLVIVWRERGERPVPADGKPGFGTRLIDMSIRAELGGAIERDHGADGLVITMRVPISSIL